MADEGIDPDKVWSPPIDAGPGDYTLNDLVEYTRGAGKVQLVPLMNDLYQTETGVAAVELVNGFVEDFFPLVSDDGAEWSYALGVAEKVLHDLLNEEYDDAWPEDPAAQEAFVEELLRQEAERR